MGIKIGDRVRFLNAVGGGIVRRFEGKDIVLVEEEDGFETPVLIRECVVVESVSSTTNLPEKQRPTPTQQMAPIIIREEPEPEDYHYKEETPEGEEITAFLAFLPIESKKLQTTDYTAYLVNDSNYFLSYSISTAQENNQIIRSQGIIEPNTKIELCGIRKEELNDWEKVRVQFISFKMKSYTFKPAIDLEFKLNPVKFYKLHSFTENDYFYEPAMLVYILKNDKSCVEPDLSKIADDKLRRDFSENTNISVRKNKGQQSRNSSVLEIDLHINALLDTVAGMSNADILEYQLDVMKKTLTENKQKKGQKIVFIHGKGDGVLRNKILQYLKQNHSNYYVQDASFREYGFGATMVTIR
jgi:hypothetical protein